MDITRFDAIDHRRFLAQDYALIDPSQVEPAQWAGFDSLALAPSKVANDPATLPQLICLRSRPESQRIHLLERADAWQRENDRALFCALLECEAEPGQLAAHLGRHLLLPTPEGGSAWVRFYDPAVFQHLRWQWSAEQLALLLGRITCWTLFGNDGWLAGRPNTVPQRLRLRLDESQWRQLDRMEWLNRSWTLLHRQAPTLASAEDAPRQLDAALVEAIGLHGLRESGDAVLCAVQRAAYGAALHRHPQMAARLQNARDGGHSYVRSCMDLNDAEYRRLAAEAAEEREGAHA